VGINRKGKQNWVDLKTTTRSATPARCDRQKNKYRRISYMVNGWGKQVMAEELFPNPEQDKLKIPYKEKK
jgi:hypothetical protein